MLKGLGGLADMGKMMKAAQEMQTKMVELQEELGRITVAETMDSDYNLQNAIGAILSLSKGDFEELRNLVTAAKIDFRDVIYWWYLENKKATHHE